MFEINRYNYEEYLLDFVDGTLSPEEENLFEKFLDQNEDLKEDVLLLKATKLDIETIELDEKNALKKENLLQGLVENNFDQLCIANIEKDLSEKEATFLNEYLNQNPNKKREFDLYKKTKLIADKTVIFNSKHNLKKSASLKLNRYLWLISAAASIAILISVYLLMNKQNISNSNFKITEVKESIELTKPEVQKENETVNTGNNNNIINGNKTSYKEVLIDDKVENITDNIREQKEMLIEIAMINPKEILFNQTINYSIRPVVINKTEGSFEYSVEHYLSVKSFLAEKINENVFKKEKKDKIDLFDIAQASIKGINKITGSKMSLERKYDKNGNLNKTEFNSRLLAFSTPVKKE